MSLLIWALGSLIAISFIGDDAYRALLLAGLAGVAFGLNAYLDYSTAPPSQQSDRSASTAASLRRVLARYGWLLDVAATMLLIFPTRWMAAGFALVLVSWLLRWWVHGRIVRRTVFDPPLLALLLMVPVSLWASADFAVSLIPLGQIVAGVNAFYALAARVESEDDVRWAAAGLIAFGVLIALLAPFGVDWIKTKLVALNQVYRHFRQMLPDGIHPNLLAGALALILPLGAAVFLYAPLEWLSSRRRLAARVLLGLGLVLMLAMLLLSQSRGGIAATAAGLVLLIAFKSRWALAAALAAVLAAGIFALSRFDVTRLSDIFFSTDTVSGLAGRLEVWSRAVYALQDVPYTGIGLGMFSRAVQVLYPLFLAGPDVDIGYAHNIYLQVGVDLGIPGLVAYLAILTIGLLLGWQAFVIARQRQDGDLAAVALGLATGLVVVMLHGLVDEAVWDTKPALLSWVLWGLIAAVDRQARPIVAQSSESAKGEDAAPGGRAWFERPTGMRHALDRLLYDPPAFDAIVQAGLAFLKPVPSERVLDLGCGDGKESLRLAEAGAHVIALELSPSQLERARARLNAHHRDWRVSLVQADAERLPFAAGSVGLIYGKAILHHLNVPAAAAEVRRVLRSDGRASFAEPLAHHPLFWLARRLTPQLRARNEKPLTLSELEQFTAGFGSHQIVSSYLAAPLAYLLRILPRGESWFKQVHSTLQRLDAVLLRRLPALARLSWYGLINVRCDVRQERPIEEPVPFPHAAAPIGRPTQSGGEGVISIWN